jgi:hypothetical protein
MSSARYTARTGSDSRGARRTHRRSFVLGMPDGSAATLTLWVMPWSLWVDTSFSAPSSGWRAWRIGRIALAFRIES